MAKDTVELSVQDRVYNLYVELVAAKRDKKDTAKAHGENIKRIESEIDEILADDAEAIAADQKGPTED